MRGLMGDRFMRRFAGNLTHRWMRSPSNPKDQDAAAKGNPIVEPDSSAAEQDIEMGAEEGKYAPDGEQPTEQTELLPKMKEDD